jgi:hypothetical protein
MTLEQWQGSSRLTRTPFGPCTTHCDFDCTRWAIQEAKTDRIPPIVAEQGCKGRVHLAIVRPNPRDDRHSGPKAVG